MPCVKTTVAVLNGLLLRLSLPPRSGRYGGGGGSPPPPPPNTPNTNVAPSNPDSGALVKRKEAEKVIVPKFPTVANRKTWRVPVARALFSASAKIDLAETAWFNETFEERETFEMLADSGSERFVSPDIKLPVALSGMIRDAPDARPLLDEVMLKEEQAFANNFILKGRQIAWMVNNWLRTNTSLDLVYSVEDLTRLQCTSDKDLHNFRHKWNMITGSMVDELKDKSLENILVSKLTNVRDSSEDLAHYYRAKEGTPDRSYQFLRARIDDCLERRQQKQNRDDMTKSLAGQQQSQAALAAQGKKKGKQEQSNPPAPKAAAAPPAESSGGGHLATANPAVTPKGGKSTGKGKQMGKEKSEKTEDASTKPPCYFYNQGHKRECLSVSTRTRFARSCCANDKTCSLSLA